MKPFKLHKIDTSPVPGKSAYQVAVCVSEHTSTTEGDIVITPTCVTEDEVEHWCNKLIANINVVKGQAKKILKK